MKILFCKLTCIDFHGLLKKNLQKNEDWEVLENRDEVDGVFYWQHSSSREALFDTLKLSLDFK